MTTSILDTAALASASLARADDARNTKTAASLKAAAQGGKMKQIDETARDFEAMFVSEMIKPMFEGIKTDGPFGGGKGEEIFRGLLVQEYGRMIAGRGIGIADQVKEHMIKIQETQQQESTHDETSAQ